MAAQGPADVLTAPAPADRSTPAGARRVRVAWSAGVWALAAWAPVLQAAGFGESQRVGSVLLGLCLFALSACVVALPVPPVARGLASLGPMAMAVLVVGLAIGEVLDVEDDPVAQYDQGFACCWVTHWLPVG